MVIFNQIINFKFFINRKVYGSTTFIVNGLVNVINKMDN